MTDEITQGIVDMLTKDNNDLYDAGNQLALAALRVANEYDGIHRLQLAVSEWATACANQGGRGEMYGKNVDGDTKQRSVTISGKEFESLKLLLGLVGSKPITGKDISEGTAKILSDKDRLRNNEAILLRERDNYVEAYESLTRLLDRISSILGAEQGETGIEAAERVMADNATLSNVNACLKRLFARSNTS